MKLREKWTKFRRRHLWLTSEERIEIFITSIKANALNRSVFEDDIQQVIKKYS